MARIRSVKMKSGGANGVMPENEMKPNIKLLGGWDARVSNYEWYDNPLSEKETKQIIADVDKLIGELKLLNAEKLSRSL